MKALSQAIFSKLSGSLLDTDINGRLYKGQADDGAEFPYAVYQIVSDVPERTFTERFENVLIQFSLFSAASGSTEIEDMFSHLKALYDECSLSITGYTLNWMRMSNAVQMTDEVTTTNGTQKVWVYHVDFEVMMSLN